MHVANQWLILQYIYMLGDDCGTTLITNYLEAVAIANKSNKNLSGELTTAIKNVWLADKQTIE